MGYDLATWSPAVGGGGADQWDLPVDALWFAGSSAGYAATPAIAEINAGVGLNQIVALIRRRVLLYNAAFGTSLTYPDYYPNDGTPRIHIAALKTAIDSLRTAEGFAVYSWSALTAGASLGWTRYIGEMRHALRMAGTMTPLLYSGHRMWTRDNDLATESLSNPSGISEVGVSASGRYRWRYGFSFVVSPAITTQPSSAACSMGVQTNGTAEYYDLFSSDTDDHVLTTGAFANLDHYEDDVINYDGTKDFTVDPARTMARAGSYMSFVFGQDGEMTGSPIAAKVCAHETEPVMAIEFGS